MKEYFVRTVSWPAPFCGDTDTQYVKATNPRACMEKVMKKYGHPCGLYSAQCWESADDFHKNKKPLARTENNLQRAEKKAYPKKGGFVYSNNGRNRFSVDGVWHEVKNPEEITILL